MDGIVKILGMNTPIPSPYMKDLRGKVFGRLTVLGLHSSNKKRTKWLCQCSCGEQSTPLTESLTGGHSTSCGCLARERRREATAKYDGKSIQYRAEYKAWFALLRRCTDADNLQYKNYGERGIKVCDRWTGTNGFDNFLLDMGPKPSKSHSIDRKDNNGDYTPTNCHWATAVTQSNNKRTNHLLTLDGVTMTISQWARKISIGKVTIRARLKMGWSVEKTLTTPVKRRRN